MIPFSYGTTYPHTFATFAMLLVDLLKKLHACGHSCAALNTSISVCQRPATSFPVSCIISCFPMLMYNGAQGGLMRVWWTINKPAEGAVAG